MNRFAPLRSLLLLTLVSSGAFAQAEYGSPREREFDFWVGEWTVLNRTLAEDGRYVDAGRARARIRPILGGKALLEEWDGRSGDRANTFGISIRVFDPTKERWVIALNWPGPNNASFSHMEGAFRHGRAEFFPPPAFEQEVPRAVRFTFSDALADSCRWDMAQPVEGGGWRTTWIMEFTRKKSVKETIADGEAIRRPPADPVCADPAARHFDGMLGVWRGDGWRRDEEGAKQQVGAELRASSSNRGCATLCWLNLSEGERVSRRFEAWSWYAGPRKWVARAIDDKEPRFHILLGDCDESGAGSYVRTDAKGETLEHTRRVSYTPRPDGRLRCEHAVSTDRGASWTKVLELDLRRD